eukprot:CAMPEP_0168323966 /NCGR_PEP_ID=MMETSP0213-20121227/3798_1 /TAXON_ID=151035 /ORGANISM="Euplotes harpa, Strain FSP1.4" /LENGTH=120 /DNA_ID=CAMNT_0008326143 /DNA_START=144 /DNA_END=506 /DNA_ORIENTATION=-
MLESQPIYIPLDKSTKRDLPKQQYTYETGKLGIRYIEQKIDMSEAVYFTHEVDLPLMDSQEAIEELSIPLMMKATLYLAKNSNGNAEESKYSSSVLDTKVPNQKVSSKLYRIGNLYSAYN